jgi:hypothetical protein
MTHEGTNELGEDEFTNRPHLVRKRARAIFWTRLGVMLLAVYIAVSMALLTTAALNGTAQRELILDCTTPDGQCYKDGSKRTAQAVLQISKQGNTREAVTRQYIIATAICQKRLGNPTINALTECVEEKVK